MKKRNIVELIIVLLIIITLGYLKFSKPKIVNYKLTDSNVNIKIPSNSYLKNECCMFAVTFRTFKSLKATETMLDKIIKSYEVIYIDDQIYYYDSENDISIDDYGVRLGFPFNEFYISFTKGKVEKE